MADKVPYVSICVFLTFLSLLSKAEISQCDEEFLASRQGSAVEFTLCYFHLMRSRPISLSPKRNYGILEALLLLAGDVAMNPGPFHFPCSVCAHPVRSNQRGIECDSCLRWCHIACSDVDYYQYQEMMESENFSWCCLSCSLS